MNEPTYCKSCGAYIPEGQKKCLACGFPAEIPPLTDSDFESMRGHSGWHRIKYYDDCTEQESAYIDLDRISNQTFFTVKLGGKVSSYYLGISPVIEREVCLVDRKTKSRIENKHIISLKLIER